MLEKVSLDKFENVLFEIKEIGTIKEIKKAIATVVGLPSCLYGQMVHLPDNMKGMVIEFNEDSVKVLLLGDESSLHSGDKVVSRGEPLHVPVGSKFVGRVINALSKPCDGQGKIEADDHYPVFRVAPGVMERVPVEDQLYTGTKVIDALIPIAKGQRELIIGDRMTGKTVLGLDAILNQKGKNVLCVYCCIGRSYASLEKVVELLRERGAMEYTIVVAATAADSPGEQFIVPYTACAIGESLMYGGRDVLVVFDDLTKHAWIHRQISLLLQRAPGREAYPGDVFYIHSQMMERAGRLRPGLGGGTMTFLPIVETQQGDVTGNIPSNLISITDGQIYLSTGLFNDGFKPAIDLGLSISRIGSRIQCDAMKDLCRRLRLDYLQYREFLRLTKVKSGVSAEAEARLRKGAAMTQVFMQDKNRPHPLEEQILLFYALKSEVPEMLDSRAWKKLKSEIFPFLLKRRPDLVRRLATGEKPDSEMTAEIDNVLREYLESENAGVAG